MSDPTQSPEPGAAAGGRTRPETDRILEHDYDGIQEYDNPMPGWWIYLFWGTVAFAVLYWLNVPGIGTGKGRIAAYEADLARAQAKYGAPAAPAAVLGEADLRAAAQDPTKLALGQTTFTTNCAACHGPDGGGVIGPNLTDDYWLHGGAPTSVLRTVQNGVLDKGMPAWGAVLKPEQVEAVVAYVLTLRGTRPANPKAPQGVPQGPAGSPAAK
jgi:cytochrome c oxidase cbb3-type subunit 3